MQEHLIQIQVIKIGQVETRGANPSISSGGEQRTLQSIPITVDCYPSQYRPLIAAITKINGGKVGTKVAFEETRAVIGKKAELKSLHLGWTTFTQLVNAAGREKYITQGGSGEDKWMILEPLVSAVQLTTRLWYSILVVKYLTFIQPVNSSRESAIAFIKSKMSPMGNSPSPSSVSDLVL